METEMEYFDYISAAREAKLDDQQLRTIEEMARRDYPDDPMLFELHVLRACNAIRDGRATYVQVVNEPVKN